MMIVLSIQRASDMAAINSTNSIQERVNDICNELYADGTKPTVRLVRSMLADIKSTSTVHKYFANWKKELEANQQSLYDKLGFSSEFTQGFMKEITRFSIEAEQRYKEQSQDASEQRDAALEDLSTSEERLHKQAAVLEQLEKECKELQTELIKAGEASKAELAKQEAANKVIVAELRQQLSDEKKENNALVSSNETLRTDIAKSELRLEGNQQYVTEVKSQNSELVDENKQLNHQFANSNKTLAGLEATISGNNKLIENLEDLKELAQQEASKATVERQTLMASLDKTRNAQDSLNSELASTKEQLNEADLSALTLRKTIDEQSSVIAKLTE